LKTGARAQALAAETVARNLYWGAAVNPRDPGLALTRRGNGYVLNGRKSFSTAARISDYINANATLEGKIASFAVPTNRSGYVANDDWDNIGQRLSDSGSVEFRDFPVYDEDLIGSPADEGAEPPVLASFNTPLIQLVFVNFYLGTAEGALAAGAGLCPRKPPVHGSRQASRGRRTIPISSSVSESSRHR
jgi:alkylation response protein AidB-like acyl-CoA dehydrogenase